MQTLAVLSFVALQLLFPPAKKEAATAVPPPAKPALLQFNWPEGLDAKVATERSREQQINTKTKGARSIKGTYRMRVRAHADGMLVRNEDYEGLQADDVILNGLGIEDLVAALVPSTVVTRDGQFVRAEDTAAIKSLLAKATEPYVTGKESLPPQFKEMLANLSSDEFLNATAASEWNGLVGAWLEFPVGEEIFEETVEERSPVLPDLRIPMKVTQRMVEKGECPRGGVRHECAVFEMRSEVERAALEGVMSRLLEGMKELAPKMTLDELEIVTVVRVRLEIGTMLPHELTATKTVTMTMSAAELPTISSLLIERRASTFTY